jgi:orotidine-5'-phosphate decarboxylase
MAKKGRDFIIFPLDVASEKEAMEWVDKVKNHVGMFKVGLELFIRTGPAVVERILAAGGAGVFLDLKFHDIPNTVAGAMAGVADLGVDLVTVHCGENPAMLEAAVKASRGKVRVLGVTVLTSVSGTHLKDAGLKKEIWEDPKALVLQRATMAKEAGCSGIVCSGKEVRWIKEILGPDFLAVTPGIRPAWDSAKDDQQRITTPADAVSSGADYLVIGRPIRNAADPVAAAKKIALEIDSI